MTSTTTFHVDFTSMTVMAVDENGEAHDLNATGEPCATQADVAAFINELRDAGAFGEDVRGELLSTLTCDERWDRPQD